MRRNRWKRKGRVLAGVIELATLLALLVAMVVTLAVVLCDHSLAELESAREAVRYAEQVGVRR